MSNSKNTMVMIPDEKGVHTKTAGYRLCRLLQRELSDKGIHMSIDRILEGLSEKKQYIHYYQKARGLKTIDC